MSQQIKQVTKCEHCGEQIALDSPPLRKYYREGRIDLAEHSVVLLDRPENSSSHAACLDGIYCDMECLVAHIKELRKSARPVTRNRLEGGAR
jgi:hypothetical protein